MVKVQFPPNTMKSPVFKDLKEFDTEEPPARLRTLMRYRDIPNGIPLFLHEGSAGPYWSTLNRPEEWMSLYSSNYFWVNRSDLPQS